MNILILNWRDPKNPKAGGAEIYTLEHAKAWRKKGHKVTWLSASFDNSSKEESIDGIRVIRIGNSLTVYLNAYLYYQENKEEIDLVIDEIHGFPFFTPLYVRKKIIALIHEVAGEIWDHMYPFPFSVIGKLFERALLNLYKGRIMITVSPSTKQALLELGLNEKKIVLIPVGSYPPKIFKEKERIPTFIFVSRLVPMKGIEDVIKAFNYIAEDEKNVKLWIVGSGEEKYEKFLKKKVDQLGISEKVIFFGKVSENKKYELLGKAHILLHASVREGWGMVVTEAGSVGTPAVAYNVLGLKDSIRNGKTGVLTQENIPEELAREAIELFRDKVRYKNFSEEARRFSESLTWEDSTEKSLKLIEKLKEESL